MITIYQNPLKLIKNLLLLGCVLTFFPMNIQARKRIVSDPVTYELSSPKNIKVKLRLAITRKEQAQGLSGVKPSDFPDDAGMLFVNEKVEMRQFWMPDTYFNLDIIYLDPNLKITAIDKNAPAHPGTVEPPVIFRATPQKAQFVLETKASSPFSRDLKIGDQLKWVSPISLSEIVLRTRQKQ